MLMRQYHGAEATKENLSTPEPTGTHTLSDGRLLKSALKMPSRVRPWESDDEQEHAATPTDGTVKKRVRIRSTDNVVHVFEKDSSMALENSNGGDGIDEGSYEGYYSSGESPLTPSGAPQHTRFTSSNGGNRLDSSQKRRNHPPSRNQRKNSSRNLSTSTLVSRNLIIAVISLLSWAISSSWLIFLNRDLMRFKGFPFLFMTPAISQVGCAAMAWGCGALGLVPVRPWSTPDFKRRLLPLVCSSVICMLLGNAGYFRLSLSFLNILKALTPAVTLIVSAAAGAETLTPMAFLSTMLIAYGTSTATWQETANNKAFHWPSFLAFVLSVFFEASRVVLAGKLLGDMARPFNPIEMLAHAGPGVGILMGIGSLLFEIKGLVALGLSGWLKLSPDLIVLCLLSFVVNISSYYSIQYTSSTTFKVVGK